MAAALSTDMPMEMQVAEVDEFHHSLHEPGGKLRLPRVEKPGFKAGDAAPSPRAPIESRITSPASK